MPKPFPAEFRRDVIAVARKGEASLAQIARDVGISESCLARRPWIADREDGLAPAAAGDRVAGPRTNPRSCGTCAGATSCSSRRTRCCGGRRRRSPATSSQRDLPVVRELAAEKIPVAVTCRILGFPQAFYKWCANPVSQRDWDDVHLINAAVDIHHDDQAFGYRFIADQLAAGEKSDICACLRQAWATPGGPWSHLMGTATPAALPVCGGPVRCRRSCSRTPLCTGSAR